MSNRKKTALGNNPLQTPASQGIFSPTTPQSDSPDSVDSAPDTPETAEVSEARNESPESGEAAPESAPKKKESRKKKKETVFLNPKLTADDKDRVNLRLPVALNDWLDDLLKKGKRRHGQKIPKEIWMQAALELFKAMPMDWHDIATEDDLREALKVIETEIKAISHQRLDKEDA